MVLFLRDTASSGPKGALACVCARCRRRSLMSASSALFVFAMLVFVSLSGCGIIKKKPPETTDQFALVGKEIPPDKAKEVLNEVGGNFAYGPGLGDTAVNVGTVVVFPPYAIYLLGNAVLSLSGYEPVTVASMLPEEHGKQWSNTYDQIVSGPGRVVAAMAGHEYRSREVADHRMKKVLEDIQAPPAQKPSGVQDTVHD